eukprot:TRINITY_DN20832_c0_g1_i1.p1 TRINITY_DN20832_c0_g1~~TRINITY_DN20832_c0_g1_i1.p1  ORF type:complete len:410 (+),score=147.81 TRINITY_DN20832_c0_g1_i1:386-1615(+)
MPLVLTVGFTCWMWLCNHQLGRLAARKPWKVPLCLEASAKHGAFLGSEPWGLCSFRLDPLAEADGFRAVSMQCSSTASLMEHSRCAQPITNAAGLAAVALNPASDGDPSELPLAGSPDFGSYDQCVGASLLLAGVHVAIVRVVQQYALTHTSESDDIDYMDWAAYVLSTTGFVFALWLIFSVLSVILCVYRSLSASMNRFRMMLIRGEARKAGLPYLKLNSTPNLDAFDATRRYLLSVATRPNALLAVLDPTIGLMILLIVSSSTLIVVRQLFDGLHFDNLSAWSVIALVLCFIYIGAVCFYGHRIQCCISTYASVLAHVQWEMTKLWNAVLGATEVVELSEAKRDRKELRVKRLWGLRAHVQGLIECCTHDPQYPRVLGASLAVLRWGLILLQLTLNTTLYFAFRKEH